MRAWAPIALVLLVAGITGCSGVGVRHTPQEGATAAEAKTSAFQLLEVRPFTTAEGLADFQEHMVKIRAVLLEYLPAEQLFREIVAEERPGAPAGVLVLDVKLLRAKSVSRPERVMLGIMAGRSGIETEVTLTDKATGTVVGREVILVQSKLSAGVFSGTDRETINHTAREIINYLKRLR